MKLVVGLGNPGPRYAGTRHNVGFRVVERLAERRGVALDQERFQGRFGQGRLPAGDGPALELALLEPLTFMNLSGAAVAAYPSTRTVPSGLRRLVVASGRMPTLSSTGCGR